MHTRVIGRTGALALPALALGAALAAATPAQQQVIIDSASGTPSLQRAPVRAPEAGQVLIKVYVAAVNPVDWKMHAMPTAHIPGLDAAGVVAAIGPDVTGVRVGEAVFTMIGRSVTGLNGTFAHYVLAPASNVIAKPRNFTYAQAAGIGTVGMTAERVIEAADVSAGQRVLITGVAGGVGSATAQIAKARGAYVIGTASARHNGYLKSIGVDEVIDYTRGPFEAQVSNVDVAIDTVGADTTARALSTVKRGGVFESIAGRVSPQACSAAGVRCIGGGAPGSYDEGALLASVAKLAAEGKYGVHIDRSFPLAEAAAAEELNRQGHTEGKIILIVDPAHAQSK